MSLKYSLILLRMVSKYVSHHLSKFYRVVPSCGFLHSCVHFVGHLAETHSIAFDTLWPWGDCLMGWAGGGRPLYGRPSSSWSKKQGVDELENPPNFQLFVSYSFLFVDLKVFLGNIPVGFSIFGRATWELGSTEIGKQISPGVVRTELDYDPVTICYNMW